MMIRMQMKCVNFGIVTVSGRRLPVLPMGGHDRADATYFSARAYRYLIGSRQIHPAFKSIWTSSCQPKHWVLFWLLLKNRLNTKNLLRRKNMNPDSFYCEMCLLQKEENLRHLFFRCPFAKNCRNQIGVTVPTWLKPE
jgi:hypothetical protein